MPHLLTLNTGSSSVKFRLFGLEKTLPLLAGGKISGIGGTPVFDVSKENGAPETYPLSEGLSHEEAIDLVLKWLEDNRLPTSVVAHRIVHGGEQYAAPVKLDEGAMKYLRSLEPLAPLHQPHNLAAVDILQSRQPGLPQMGCFDTAFHARHGRLFNEFALPQSIRDQGVKRYGFHGLSYDWIAHCLKTDYPHLVEGKVVVAHLGNGASLCAMQNGRSIDTTMGMTALDGLPMGTRCGALDAGAVLYIIRTLGLSPDETENILYNESGLKGLSGLTNDVKVLSESTNKKAVFALDYFAIKAAQFIATMAVSLGGMDALIFTGGIGENSEKIRIMILRHLSFLPPFEHHIIPANEERAMAIEIWRNFQKEMHP